MAHIFKNKVVFITGGSRGIGRAIALALAEQGACITIAAKTTEPQSNLAGTIYTVAEEVEAAGGRALAVATDIRDEQAIAAAVQQTVDSFGGIDILINNASAINLTATLDTPMKRFDLMFAVNVRGTFATSQACIPHLKKAQNPHILTFSPPLNMHAKWFKNHLAYTMSKYGMSMCTLGLSEELRADGIAVNSLWPKTIIATAAIENNFPKQVYQACRKPQIMADAVLAILQKNSREYSGQFLVDEDVLLAHGVTDFDQYALDPQVPTIKDYYLD